MQKLPCVQVQENGLKRDVCKYDIRSNPLVVVPYILIAYAVTADKKYDAKKQVQNIIQMAEFF